ncbi:DUF551 domain-containing protein [Enterobacter cloacae]|uniref:DUF551 domain-containing protein n=1 Tax=Enterobacter cloacae TaxID=550 RepID=UPI001F3F3CAC|nr:DUF551 domain-containing protein [Enterobacter cloacae]
MAELTKEWLLTTIAELEEERDATPGVVNVDVAIALAAMKLALASLEAEAVAWLLSGGGAKNNVSFDSGNAYADPLREVTPLYTAPPAPVSVPDAMEMDDDFDSAFEHGKAVGWNAYRAAMLQGADGNSPVIPDGWVACSELMPEQFKAILAFNEYGEVWSGAYDRYWNFYCDNLLVEHVTHWMPLPAAPQQEVTQALAKGMERYGDAMQKLADSGD